MRALKTEISKRFKSRSGSFTVFAVMLFMAVLLAVTAAINAAVSVCNIGAVNSLGRLWGKSILGEYDLFIKERYGILGFYGNDYIAEEKLDFYSQYSFSEKKHIKVNDIWALTGEYSLDREEKLKEQIEDAVLYDAKPQVRSKISMQEQRGASENLHDVQNNRQAERYIDSEWIKKSLPSYGKTGGFYLTELVNKIKSGLNIDKAAGQLAADIYIFRFFKSLGNDRALGETYFNSEIEYIISGKLSDRDAEKDVKGKIKTMRNMLNLYYLYTCPEKRQAVMTMAQTVTPGPAAVLTQAVMMETWAYMEAENDINILYSGETVPLLKKDCNWALSLENVFNSGETAENESRGSQTCVWPQAVEGEKYDDYLGILLLGLTEETKLLRIADLIQINGKYLYCDSFLMKDYCSGLEYGIKVNGNECRFRESY